MYHDVGVHIVPNSYARLGREGRNKLRPYIIFCTSDSASYRCSEGFHSHIHGSSRDLPSSG
jgi:hypothetical protein